MKSAVANLFAVLVLSGNAHATLTDFEDLMPDREYRVGSVITSKGLLFEVVPFRTSTGLFSVTFSNHSGPLGNTGLATGYAALDFALPVSANHISFDCLASYFDAGLTVDGIDVPFEDGLDSLNGLIVGGILIEVQSTIMDSFLAKRITLTGRINSFSVGGVELHIDNVAVFVPEPSSAALTILAVAFIGCRRL